MAIDFQPHDSEIDFEESPSGTYEVPNYPFVTRPQTPREHGEVTRNIRHGLIGAAQGLANIPSGTVNLVRPNTVPRFNFAPEDTASEIGQIAAPLAAPGGFMKGVSYIPKAIKSINAITAPRKGKPVLNALLKAGQTGVGTGYVNALEHPENEQAEFLKGVGIGAPMGALIPSIASASPLVALAARTGLGGLAGAQIGHPIIGAMSGAGLPLRTLLGMESKPKIAEEMLAGLEPKDVSKAMAANRRLGTNVTPGEASGNYVVSGREGALKRTVGGGQAGYRLEEAEKYKQQNAINRMLDKVYKPSTENEKQINALYEKAYHPKNDLPQEVVLAMNEDPIMSNAIQSVRRNPAFAKIPLNNYEFLAQVDRTLGRQYNGLRITDPNSAYEVKQVKNVFNNFLKENNPEYLEATKAAQPKIVRENIESKLNKEAEDYTAKNLYSRLLNSRKSYRDLLRDTKNFPEAQQDIKDMRAGWKNLANMKTTSQSESQAKTALDQARNIGNFIKTTIKNVLGKKADEARLKYIYGKDWEKDFANLKNIKEKNERRKQMTQFIVDTGTRAGLATDQVQNLMKLITEDNTE